MANDPVLIAYAVRRNRSGRVNYTRIGQAYPHNVGEGLTVILEALPLGGGHIVLLELDEADDRRLLAQARRRERDRQQERARKTSAEATTGRGEDTNSREQVAAPSHFPILRFIGG